MFICKIALRRLWTGNVRCAHHFRQKLAGTLFADIYEAQNQKPGRFANCFHVAVIPDILNPAMNFVLLAWENEASARRFTRNVVERRLVNHALLVAAPHGRQIEFQYHHPQSGIAGAGWLRKSGWGFASIARIFWACWRRWGQRERSTTAMTFSSSFWTEFASYTQPDESCWSWSNRLPSESPWTWTVSGRRWNKDYCYWNTVGITAWSVGKAICRCS